MNAYIEKFSTSNRIDTAQFLRSIAQNVATALAEDTEGDLEGGDLSALLVDANKNIHARILAREEAIICGTPWVEEAMRQVDPSIQIEWLVSEGQRATANQTIVNFHGPARAILTAERTALNFLQMLSAVATKTEKFVALALGTKAHIVDTRKTIPGLRLAQKYAVLVGGGVNHRIGLYDAILIKENHIASAGGVAEALAHAQEVSRAAKQPARFVEIEVERLDQLQIALEHGAHMVLLDNMQPDTIRLAIVMNEAHAAETGAPKAILEVSGGVNEATLRGLAETGVDRISIGSLTKDVKAIDFSMRFEGL